MNAIETKRARKLSRMVIGAVLVLAVVGVAARVLESKKVFASNGVVNGHHEQRSDRSGGDAALLHEVSADEPVGRDV
jgi:dihydrodipicolinate reductase